MDTTFCHRLPKLELHAHLNGSLSVETLKELYEYQQETNKNSLKDFDTSFFCKDSCSLSEFFDIFKIAYTLTSTPESVEIATQRVIEDFSKDNVVYLELRSTLRKESNMSKQDYIESMIKGVLKSQTLFPNIVVKLIISVNRSESLESAEENIKLAISYAKKYPDIVVGIDTSGNPTKSKFKNFVNVLQLARNEGLKFTVHCAEVVENDEVKDILDFSPERIGHGTCIHESFGGNESNWKQLLVKKIPVELCITSNIKCHTVTSLDNHHFKLLYSNNHPITLATDDKGVFGTTLSNEYEIVKKDFNLSEEELWKLSYNSIDYIFGSENDKASLRTILEQWKAGNFKCSSYQ